MYELIKLNNEYYLLGNGEPYPYAYHINKKEILKIDGVGEISGELFHSQGFNYAADCKKIIATTDITLINQDRIPIELLNKSLLNDLTKNEYIDNIWEVEVDIKIVPDFYARGGLRPVGEIGGHEIDRTYKRYKYEIKKIKNK